MVKLAPGYTSILEWTGGGTEQTMAETAVRFPALDVSITARCAHGGDPELTSTRFQSAVPFRLRKWFSVHEQHGTQGLNGHIGQLRKHAGTSPAWYERSLTIEPRPLARPCPSVVSQLILDLIQTGSVPQRRPLLVLSIKVITTGGARNHGQYSGPEA